MPQVCALARNDMQKLGRCLRWQGEMLGGRCQGNCQKLHTQKRRCLLPVIARSEATWQSASPQRNRTNWLLFGRIRRRLRICPRCWFSFCGTARRNGLPQVCALARNDMQKLGRCLRWQEEMLGGRCQGNCQKRPCTRRSAAVFCLSLRGAKRRDNPHPCRGTEQIGCCLGEFIGGYGFTFSTFCVLYWRW